MKPYQKIIDDLFSKATQYLSSQSIEIIKRALIFAEKAHLGQDRKSGEPYIIHPINVAIILTNLEQDPASVAAGLLHDTLEDCNVTKEDLIKEFGEDIYHLVEGVTKLGKFLFESKEAEQAENFRKMFLAMSSDIRVIIIKLADRLHNMQTIEWLSPERQKRMAAETKEIFAPLAHRLGIGSLKWELEDLSFSIIEPEEFQNIKKLVTLKREDRVEYVYSFIDKIQSLIELSHIEATITGRPKHFYSIYKKMQKQNLPFEELYDTFGIRVIVETVKECYQALGIIHSTYKPLSGRIKDYIAMPKSNMYQSLHTTVIGPRGKPVEIQIRTQKMHQISEYGVAAHWQYKEGKGTTKYDADFKWLREIIDTQKEIKQPETLLQELKMDLFVDEVFVFTPKGDVHVLPKGATPIDFAYRIHTEVGNRCKGAKVNNYIVPLAYELQNGDQLEIMTHKKPRPNIDWLNIVVSSTAKSKIKQWFKRKNAAENAKIGRTKLEKELMVHDLNPKTYLSNDFFTVFEKKFRVKKFDELFVLIAHGEITPREIITIINKHIKAETPKTEDIPETTIKRKLKRKPAKSNIKILGENNVLIRIAKCCNPLPGEPIIGFITIGAGVSIHKANCKQVLNLKEKDQARLVESEWDLTLNINDTHSATVEVEVFDRIGLLRDIINKVSDLKTNINDIKILNAKTNTTAKLVLHLDIKDISHLNIIKNALKNIPDVMAVRRLS